MIERYVGEALRFRELGEKAMFDESRSTAFGEMAHFSAKALGAEGVRHYMEGEQFFSNIAEEFKQFTQDGGKRKGKR